MRERLPLCLVLAGTLTVLAGSIITVMLLVRRDGCDGVATGCQGYTNSIHWTFPLILLGAVCFVAAGLSATTLGRGRHRGVPRDEATERDGPGSG
ncbi:MAG: hypothetical protein WAL61_10650 [Acidimicrobiales bacterium]